MAQAMFREDKCVEEIYNFLFADTDSEDESEFEGFTEEDVADLSNTLHAVSKDTRQISNGLQKNNESSVRTEPLHYRSGKDILSDSPTTSSNEERSEPEKFADALFEIIWFDTDSYDDSELSIEGHSYRDLLPKVIDLRVCLEKISDDEKMVQNKGKRPSEEKCEKSENVKISNRPYRLRNRAKSYVQEKPKTPILKRNRTV